MISIRAQSPNKSLRRLATAASSAVVVALAAAAAAGGTAADVFSWFSMMMITMSKWLRTTYD
jgi:hypothetical protein